MKRPLITLLTDFGSADHYAGAMKGVILGICPDAQLVDISHEITPYAVAEAAFTLAQAWTCFPVGTIHVAIVDPGGTLIYYEKMDNTQMGSATFAIKKARSAALFKRPTKAFQDRLTSGNAGLSVLAVEGAVPVEGGLPLIVDGHILGAIGVSGDTSEHDGQCAQAGIDALK